MANNSRSVFDELMYKYSGSSDNQPGSRSTGSKGGRKSGKRTRQSSVNDSPRDTLVSLLDKYSLPEAPSLDNPTQPADRYNGPVSRFSLPKAPSAAPAPSAPAGMSPEDIAMERLRWYGMNNGRDPGGFKMNVDIGGFQQGAFTGSGKSGPAAQEEPGTNAAKGTSKYLSHVFDNASNRESKLGDSPYAEILDREDFAEKSQAGDSKRRWFGGDELYDYINDIGDEREQADLAQRHGTGGKGYGKYAFMTDEERGVYNYLYATEGKKAANRFLNSLEPELNAQWYSGASKYNAQQALEHPLLYSAATVAAQPARMASSALAVIEDTFKTAAAGGQRTHGAFGNLIDANTAQMAGELGSRWDRDTANPFAEYADYEGGAKDVIDPNSELRQLSRMTTDVRGAIAEDIEKNPGAIGTYFAQQAQMQAGELGARYAMANGDEGENPFDAARKSITPMAAGKAASFAYQTAMSAADSAVNMAMASGLAQGYAGIKGLDLATKAGTDALMKATNVIGSLTMSSEVMSLGVAEAKEKGYSDEGALMIGLIRGTIEYGSEAIGGEWVIKNIQADPLNFVKTMVLNMIPEGVEEVMSDAGNGAVNLIVDALFGTEESGWNQMVGEFSKEGWQQDYPGVAKVMETMGWGDDPQAAALVYFAGEEGLSFLGGSLATVGTSAVQTRNVRLGIDATAKRLGATPQEVVRLMEDYQTENPGDIYDLAQRFDVEDEAGFRASVSAEKPAAETLDEKKQADRAEAQTIRGKLKNGFRSAGVKMTDAELDVLAGGFETGETDEETYLRGVHAAFRLGESGNFTLQQAIRSTDTAAELTPEQFRHAFELGQAKAGIADTADVSTEEGKTRIEAAVADLGEFGEEAAAAYEEGQDVDTYAAAMYKAAALYAAGGKDLTAIAAEVRSGERSDIIGTLTDAQLEVAGKIGAQMAEQSMQSVRDRAAEFAAAREQAAAMTAQGVQTRRGGVTIASESGTVAGIKYDAVDESRLSKVQKSTVGAVKAVSEALGLDVVVVSSKEKTGGVYTGGGRIYLNIDAGTNIRGFGKAIAAGSFAHEMVHWMREYAGEEYKALEKITTGHLSADQLDKLVQEQLRLEPNLTPDGALEEVIANACQPLLKNSHAIRELVRQDMNLAERMLDRLKEFTENLKAAFSEIDFKDNLSIYHAVQAMEGHLEEMQTAFDEAIKAAKQNMAAERAVKGAAAQQTETKAAAQTEITFGDNNELKIDEDGQMKLFQRLDHSDERVSTATEKKLQSIDSTALDGVVVSDDLARLMREQGFSKPVDPVEQLGTKYQVWTTDDWESNYLTKGGDLPVAAQIRDFTNAMIADDAIMGYVPAGHYQKSRFGPLRKNIEYRWTFDMDASCPRTFQFVNYRNALQTIAGRPLTDNEAINLMYLMRKMNQQIPCTYCYVENKRVMKSKSYLDWFQARADVMSAATDEEALKKMYSYDAKKGTVGAAAQKVFDEWRADVRAGKAYYPTAQEVWTGWNTAKNTIFNFLDKGLENGVIRFGEGVRKPTSQKQMVDAACKRFNITDKAARREIEGFVAKWRYDILAGTGHKYDITNDASVDTINQDILRLNRLASNYASSVSQARLVDDYIPYTDQLKNVSKADKAYIMGMGGIRKHSSNDFRMDYVQDYFLFYADLAAGGWTGHTYTKSVDFCKVFGRTGDRINLSIAMNTENGKIVENQQEGAAWKDARELREAYKDVGVMAMVTDNAQLSFALNNDWIDMCIPFHASGLPKAVWYNIRAWSDYTSVQLESYFNSAEMKQRLQDAGVDIKGLTTDEVEALFNSTFKIPVILNKNGQRVKPHFFPSDTVIEGPGGVKQIVPGHHNDTAKYLELCKQYGVHPRFYGTKVTDAQGNVIDVTEHPNYVKLIKETSRTDTEQEPIKFNFNERDDYLGMTPMEYAMKRMQEEAKIGGYANTANDPMGIVDMFKDLYLGQDRDIGWLPSESKEEGDAADKLLTAIEYTKNAHKEMYDADVQTLDVEGYQKVLVEQTAPAQQEVFKLQTWSEGTVYNDRALVSEETLDKWMSSQWYGSSNPDYAQAFITSMSPSQFLKLTTLYDEGRVRAETTDNSIDRVMASSESQPIQLMIDTETGKVVGHEGRHRMVALERNGVYEVPVLLFDSGNKYSKKAMKEFVLHGQDFHGQNNYQQATVFDVYPLNQSHRQQIVNAYSKQTYSEGFKERNNGAKTVRFQRIDFTADDTAAESRGRETAYARLQNENAILNRTVKVLNRLTGKQASTIEALQKQLHLSKDAGVREDDARKLARSIVSEYGSSADVNEIAKELKSLGDYILQTKPSEIRETEIKDQARNIAAEIIGSVSETVDLTEGVGMPQDVAAKITPEQVNPFEAYMGEATEGLANRIAMGAVGGILRQDVTAMDRQKARRDALREQILQLKAEGKATRKEAYSLYETIYDLSLQLDKAESQYKSLQTSSERRLAQVREEGRARVAEQRAEKWAKVEETKKYYQDMIERQREKRENAAGVRGYRSKIQKLYKEFVREIQHPTETKHIPPQLMQQAADILSILNMDNSRPGSKAGAALKAKLAALKVAYDAIQKDADFRAAAVYDPIISEMMQAMIEQVGDTPINRMSREQLEIVYNVLKAMKVTAAKALKIQIGNEERDAYQTSVQMTNETRSARNIAGTGLFARWLNAQLSPERMFHRLGGFHKNSMWSKVYQMLNGGQLRSTEIFVEGSRIFEQLLKGKDYDAFVNPNRTVDIGLKDEDGNGVPITRGMMVSLYMHLQNEDNVRHAMLGGIEIPALKDYYNGRKTRGTERSVRVGGIALDSVKQIAELREQLKETEDENERKDIQAEIDDLTQDALSYADELREEIENQLTDYDRKWIGAIRELFDNFSKNKINETTMAVYGIKKASVENYYPIWVDGDFLNTPFESVARDFSIENVGFLKERVVSSKPIRLADASEVAASQLKKVAQYAGLMPVIRDFNKIWGKTQANYADSLKKAVHTVFGETGTQYIENLMADLNGARSQNDGFGGELFGRIRGNMAQAALTLSMRTAFGQTASYPTAAAVVGWGPLMKALARGGRSSRVFSRADQSLIEKYSPLLAYRMKGYSSIELGDIASSNSKQNRLWRKMRWLTGWIQAMDGATVGRLWYAAEYYVQDHNKALEKGTDEYYQEVAKVFNDIVEKTQPNYTTLQRPDILRNPNALVRSLTMFLTQRLQNVNIVIDAAATLAQAKKDYAAKRFDVTREDVHEAAVNSRRAVVSQVVAAANIVAFKFAADAILHSMNAYRDDDKELTGESVGLELLDMFLDSVTGNFLWGSELYDLVESRVFGKTYYGIELSSVSTVTDMIDSFNNLLTEMLESGVSGDNFEKRLNAAAKSLASVLGIPLGNAEKIILGAVYHAEDIANGNFGSFDAGVYWVSKAKEKKWKENLESLGVTQKQFAQFLKEAETNGKSGLTQDEIGTWLNGQLEAGNITEEQADAYWAAAASGKKTYAEWKAGAEKKAAKADGVKRSANAGVKRSAVTVEGQFGKGNIDLFDRDTNLYDEDGNLMTVRSMSFEENGKEILVPTIVKRDGQWVALSDDEAIDWYHETGEYLGIFDTVEEADAYAVALHEQQEGLYTDSAPQRLTPPDTGESWRQRLAGHKRKIAEGTERVLKTEPVAGMKASGRMRTFLGDLVEDPTWFIEDLMADPLWTLDSAASEIFHDIDEQYPVPQIGLGKPGEFIPFPMDNTEEEVWDEDYETPLEARKAALAEEAEYLRDLLENELISPEDAYNLLCEWLIENTPKEKPVDMVQ